MTSKTNVNRSYAEFYCSTTCHVCKVKSERLKYCKNCKVYRYCSKEHQIIDWPLHKPICNILTEFLRVSSLTHCFAHNNDGWLFPKVKIKMLLENQLQRPLTPAENQLWMFPRACAVCHETNIENLFDCPNCPAASYCSLHHQIQHQNKHSKICSKMQLQHELYCRKMSGNSFDDINKTLLTVEDASKLFAVDYKEINDDVLRDVQLADKLSHVMTLLSSLKMCNVLHFGRIKDGDSLTVQIVGATYEWNNFDLYITELITHWIPNLKQINLIFVGPELFVGDGEDWKKCGECVKRDVKVLYCYESILYEKYVNSEKYKIPDVVCVFNCGFHEAEHSDDDSWRDSLAMLIIPNVPLVFTSYTYEEAVKDFDRLMELSNDSDAISIFKKYEINTFHSPVPLRDWIKPDEVYYNNNFLSVLMRKE